MRSPWALESVGSLPCSLFTSGNQWSVIKEAWMNLVWYLVGLRPQSLFLRISETFSSGTELESYQTYPLVFGQLTC